MTKRALQNSAKLLLKLGVLLLVVAEVQAQDVLKKGVYDGFEDPSLSSFWETRRLSPGSVQMQSTYVRAGHGAAKITVHSRDMFMAGRHGDADNERDELLESRPLVSKQNSLYESSWSMYVSADFPIVPVRLVVAQWKQYCDSDLKACNDDSPVLAVRYVAGSLLITQDINHKYIVLFKEKKDLRSHWLDLRFQVRFTPQQDGEVKAWLDGRQVVSFIGATANAETSETGYDEHGIFYFKMGLYRNVMSQPMTVYLDEYRKREIIE